MSNFLKLTYYEKSNVTVTNCFIYFYKHLMYPTSYWFSSKLTINIIFSFTNNHSPHQQFVKFFEKKFEFLALFLQESLENISLNDS